ncbi:hypothetical protein GTA08_BOTSDO03663 [Neofusicoccum parvum]|uniref:Uncharacterized protein n=1 Tax=Neofusicoccum parvum TaxID=310453 RepID=A0ACB5S081_9PEZI|nr:hypothetical protein GTA08_BOTSDO03663 [Neofusicoccum parvum]
MPPVFVPPGQSRVNTPPSVKAGRTAAGKPSGFFFEGPSPGHIDRAEDESPGPRARSSPRGPSSSGFWDSDAVLMSQSPSVVDAWRDKPPQPSPLLTSDPERDWFRVRMDQIMTEEPRATGRDVDVDAVGGPAFAWDVPEHLPGSPLCPLSPKHKSGGKGICVYHGRRKTQRFVGSA